MFRSFSSLLGVFFLTVGVVAVASLTKTHAAVPVAPPRNRQPANAPRGRLMESPAFHARFSVN